MLSFSLLYLAENSSSMGKYSSWLQAGNHWNHFWIGAISGIFSMLFVIGLACGMECKDVAYHSDMNKPVKSWAWHYWSWGDWNATLAGGIVVMTIKAILIALILQ